MKAAIFNVNRRISSDGPRLISSILRARGFETKLFFMGESYKPGTPLLTPKMADRVIHEIADCDVVLVSSMSACSLAAYEISDLIKERTQKTVIFGGVHATSLPKQTLEHADIVGIGECEEAIVELMEKLRDGLDPTDTRNFWFKTDGEIIKNAVRPFVSDLDQLPFPDYSFKDHLYLLHDEFTSDVDQVVAEFNWGAGSIRKNKVSYSMLTTRGCPHECNYCYMSLFLKTYDVKKIRKMSVDRIIDELKHVKETMPYVGIIDFVDDDFFVRNTDDMRRFAELYKEHIGLDFGCGTSPDVLTEEKLNILLDAGLKIVQVGVQSGSERINRDVFNRRVSKEKQARAFQILSRAARERGLTVYYDFIVNNPYETPRDIKQSFELASRIPGSFNANVHNLTFYPGTPIYERAINEGIITDDPKLYNRRMGKVVLDTRTNFSTLVLVSYLKKRLPKILARVLMTHPFDWLGQALFRIVQPRKRLASARKLIKAVR